MLDGIHLKELEVDNEHGIVVLEPNDLISCTTLMQSVFCSRKAVLSENLRGNSTNEAMLLGSIVHSFFQVAIHCF